MDRGQVVGLLWLSIVGLYAVLIPAQAYLNEDNESQRCEIKLQTNGSWFMEVPFYIQEKLRADPTSELTLLISIEGKVRPIHGAFIHANGQVEITWPVLSATFGHSILAECHSYVRLELHGQQPSTEECFCPDISTTDPPANPSGDAAPVARADQSVTTRAPLVAATDPPTTEGGLPLYAILLICCALALGMITVAGISCKYRERIAAFFNELKAKVSSGTSSTETIDLEAARKLSPNSQP